MDGCSCSARVKFDGLSSAYQRALWAVIAINAAMFLVEMSAGMLSGSQALQADALDFLGDTATYGMTLLVIGLPLIRRSRAALLKGVSLGAMGLWVLGSTVHHLLAVGLPRAEVMGGIGVLALVANLSSVLLLLKHRNGDANVRSVWLCSRNDAIGNLAVVLAAGGVWTTNTAWPDLIVAGVMASLFLYSSLGIIRQAIGELDLSPSGHRQTARRLN